MTDRTPSSWVFRVVSPATVVRVNDRLGRLSRPAFRTLAAGFLLYYAFNHDGIRDAPGFRETPAEMLGLEWLLPYPRLIPIALMAGSLLFGVFKFSLAMVAVTAERRLDGESEAI